MAEPIDTTPLHELDAYQLREIYFPGFGPSRIDWATPGVAARQLWRAC